MVGWEDAEGKRVTKEDAAGFTRFIYLGPDMLALLQERDAAGNVVAHYTMGDGLEAMRRGEESRFYHYDWLGSTFELTDAAGAVTDEYLYDAWGNALAASGATPNPHRYVGRERYYEMPGTGLYHVGHRQFSPAVARFISEDPIDRGFRRYDYVENGACSGTDSLGLAPDLASDLKRRNAAIEALTVGDTESRHTPLACLTLKTRARGLSRVTYCERAPGQRRPYGYDARGRLDVREHRRDPMGWYRPHPMAALLGRAAVEVLVRAAPGVLPDVAFGPVHRAMLEKWKAKDRVDYRVPMGEYFKAASAERQQYAYELASAIAWAETYVRRDGEVAETWGTIHGVAPVDKVAQPDWWWAIGNHLGWGKATIRRASGSYSLTFTWHLEDTYTHHGKFPTGVLEEKGIAAPFLITGSYQATYHWAAGAGTAVVPVYP